MRDHCGLCKRFGVVIVGQLIVGSGEKFVAGAVGQPAWLVCWKCEMNMGRVFDEMRAHVPAWKTGLTGTCRSCGGATSPSLALALWPRYANAKPQWSICVDCTRIFIVCAPILQAEAQL